jgi:hypothetical protein
MAHIRAGMPRRLAPCVQLLREHTVHGKVNREAVLAALNARCRDVHGYPLTMDDVVMLNHVIARYESRQPYRIGG